MLFRSFIIHENLKDAFLNNAQCQFYRTEDLCANMEALEEFNFVLTISLNQPVNEALAPSQVLNPFVFATPGIYHGPEFTSPPGRSLEIHLKNAKPSVRFNHSLLGSHDDDSDLDNQFVSENDMPWALQLPMLWSHPMERTDIGRAYPDFHRFVRSAGAEAKTWYRFEQSNSNLVIKNLEGETP